MKINIFLLIFTLCYIQIKSQDNIKFSQTIWTDCKVYEIFIKNIEQPERAKYITNTLYKNPDIKFAFTNYKEKKSYVITDKKLDIKEIKSKITNLGYEIININSFVFKDDIFFDFYYKATFSVMGKMPNHINTSMKKRDDALYDKAKEIFINKYPEEYKSLNSSQMTEEQIKEKKIKEESRKNH